MTPPAVLTIPEVAVLLQVSRLRAYQLAREGQLPVIRFGRQVRVLRKPLEAMLSGSQTASGE